MLSSPISALEKPEHEPFVIVTVPKAGTHLLTKIMEKITQKHNLAVNGYTPTPQEIIAKLRQAKRCNGFATTFALPSEEIIDALKKEKYKIIFLIRDPRDITVSLLFSIMTSQAFGPLDMNQPFGQLTTNEKLLEMITGDRFKCSAPLRLIGRRLAWLRQEPNLILPVYFENLVGPEGGGTKENQLAEIHKIADFISLQLSDSQIEQRCKNLYGTIGEESFRSGKIGDWQRYFTQEHIEAFKRVFGSQLIELGYTKDFNW